MAPHTSNSGITTSVQSMAPRPASASAFAISILTSLLAADAFRFFLYSLVNNLAAIFALVGKKDLYLT